MCLSHLWSAESHPVSLSLLFFSTLENNLFNKFTKGFSEIGMSLAKYNCKLIVSLWLAFLSIQSEPIKIDATLAAIKVNLFYKMVKTCVHSVFII